MWTADAATSVWSSWSHWPRSEYIYGSEQCRSVNSNRQNSMQVILYDILPDKVGNLSLSFLFIFCCKVCSSQGLLQGLVWSLELGSTVATKKGKLLKRCGHIHQRNTFCFSVFGIYFCGSRYCSILGRTKPEMLCFYGWCDKLLDQWFQNPNLMHLHRSFIELHTYTPSLMSPVVFQISFFWIDFYLNAFNQT